VHFFVVEYTTLALPRGGEAYDRDISGLHLQGPIPEASYRLVVDILLREEPDEGDEADEDDGKQADVDDNGGTEYELHPATFALLIGPGAAARPRGGVSDLWSRQN
jgi:hypothetical protein